MSWTILFLLIAGLGSTAMILLQRRRELASMQSAASGRREAIAQGSHKAKLQYPDVDLSQCLGCGTCIKACPEEGVLELIHGQAVVVHGARCVGHGMCAEECPTGAIRITMGDLSERSDIPVITETHEVEGSPGLYLGGEVTGFALIRVAIKHGVSIANSIAEALPTARLDGDALDLCIVGAGPAGLACALEAKRQGLRFTLVEQGSLGGTVSSYPRRKLVMTQPVELPLYGTLKQTSYLKEQLMEVWEGLVQKHDLPVQTKTKFLGLQQGGDGLWNVDTSAGIVRARNVCLAIGRRGTPRKLGVPGEDMSHVAHSLLDAQAYQARKILVVGGGDSAVEAALGLAEQDGNQVSLSYRKAAFGAIKGRNLKHIQLAMAEGRVNVIFESQVKLIENGFVHLCLTKTEEQLCLPNEDVFVMIGGEAPFQLLRDAGVSFEHKQAEPSAPGTPGAERGLLVAVGLAFTISILALILLLWRLDYYGESHLARLQSHWHTYLRPSGTVGLTLGVISIVLVVANLSYLLRRNSMPGMRWGSLRVWMIVHAATGLLALLFAVLHSAMAPRSTLGGYALAGLAILSFTGGVGRYLYAFVPHAANGRELALEELRRKMQRISAVWEHRNPRFGQQVAETIDMVLAEGRWSGFLLLRVWTVIRTHSHMRAALGDLRRLGIEEGIAPDQLTEFIGIAKEAQKNAMMAAHFEDLRAILASWRFFHRWVALLMFLFVVAHMFFAVRYGGVFA